MRINPDESLNGLSLTFKEVDFNEFNFLLLNQGRSQEIGAIQSQYINELKNKSPKAGTLGLFACSKLVGALSYGVEDLPGNDQNVAGRLDVVVTIDEARGHGVGGLLVSKLFCLFAENFNSHLKEVSTIAQHPAVAKSVEQMGLEAPKYYSKVPRYSLSLDNEVTFNSFIKKSKSYFAQKIQHMKLECLNCKNKSWGKAWCNQDKKRIRA